MNLYRAQLPQLSNDIYLTDLGLDRHLQAVDSTPTQVVAAHTLLYESAGRYALAKYYRAFLTLSKNFNTGFILDSPTWKAHTCWAKQLAVTENELARANRDGVNFIADLRDEFFNNQLPIVLNGVIGPKDGGLNQTSFKLEKEAQEYHTQQLSWLEETEIDMVTAHSFSQSTEAIGLVRAARRLQIPCAISFALNEDGQLPSGQFLEDAIVEVDAATNHSPIYYLIQCEHPNILDSVLKYGPWLNRIHGLRCNAAPCINKQSCNKKSINKKSIDNKNVKTQSPSDSNSNNVILCYQQLLDRMPWLNILGGCIDLKFNHSTTPCHVHDK